MPIRVKCSCGHAINAPDKFAGKAVQCPKCQASVSIPKKVVKATAVEAKPVEPLEVQPIAAEPSDDGLDLLGDEALGIEPIAQDDLEADPLGIDLSDFTEDGGEDPFDLGDDAMVADPLATDPMAVDPLGVDLSQDPLAMPVASDPLAMPATAATGGTLAAQPPQPAGKSSAATDGKSLPIKLAFGGGGVLAGLVFGSLAVWIASMFLNSGKASTPTATGGNATSESSPEQASLASVKLVQSEHLQKAIKEAFTEREFRQLFGISPDRYLRTMMEDAFGIMKVTPEYESAMKAGETEERDVAQVDKILQVMEDCGVTPGREKFDGRPSEVQALVARTFWRSFIMEGDFSTLDDWNSVRKLDIELNGSNSVFNDLNSSSVAAEIRSMDLRDRFRRVGYGLLNHASAFKRFPNFQGKPSAKDASHSWRVVILNFMDGRNLFNSLDLSQPFDSPQNSEFASQMPADFAIPGKDGKPQTQMRALALPDSVLGAESASSFPSVRDGSELTALFILAGEECSTDWMNPEPFEFKPDQDASQFGTPPTKNGYPVFMVDGTIRIVRPKTSGAAIASLFNRTDGGMTLLDVDQEFPRVKSEPNLKVSMIRQLRQKYRNITEN